MDLKKFKTGSLIGDGVLGGLQKQLDRTDLDEKLEQGVAKVSASVDFNRFAAILAATDAVHDKPLFKEGVLLLGEVIEAAGQKVEVKVAEKAADKKGKK